VPPPRRDRSRPQTSHSSGLQGSESPGWQPRALRWHATSARSESNRIRTPTRSRPAYSRRPRPRFPPFPARLARRPSLEVPFPFSGHCCMYCRPSFVLEKKIEHLSFSLYARRHCIIYCYDYYFFVLRSGTESQAPKPPDRRRPSALVLRSAVTHYMYHTHC